MIHRKSKRRNEALEKNVLDYLYGEENSQYDQHAKNLLSDRQFLAEILQETVAEYRNVSRKDIAEKYIEGMPQVSQVPVNLDFPTRKGKKIRGARNEDGSPTEGIVTYDIFFYARLPESLEQIALIINIEAQRTYRESKLHYDLIRRAIYYGCRMISSQKERDFTKQDYNGIHKVYTIWLCMESPTEESIINRYAIHEEQLLGRYVEKSTGYDLMTIIMVYLGKEMSANRLVRLLQVLFTETEKSAQEKEDFLRDKYDMTLTEEIGEELTSMCNLSLGIAEKAYNNGIEQGIEKGVIKVARTMIRNGSHNNEISAATMLSSDKIDALRDEIKKQLH